jgi:hypothetical protein
LLMSISGSSRKAAGLTASLEVLSAVSIPHLRK